MQRKLPRRIMTVVLSLAMLLTLLPVAAFAADENTGETSTSGIELSKTVTLTDDGTYTIDLEAYATGTTTTKTTTSSTPLDIVLVIDQSGSMAYDDDGENTNTESDRRYAELKTALNSFVSTIQKDAADNDVDHRIAIVGYASNATAGQSTSVTGVGVTENSSTSIFVNTGLYISGYMKNYGTLTYTATYDVSTSNTYYVLVDGTYYSVSYSNGGMGGQTSGWSYRTGNGPNSSSESVTPKTSESGSGTQFYEQSYTYLTSTDYQSALVSANVDGSVNSSLTSAISNMKSSGGTYTEYGLEMAKNVFANNSAEYTYTDDDGNTQTGTRKRIVVLFTDGETNSEVSDVLDISNSLKKDYNATVYCVGFGSSVNDDFLSYVSSNYGSDTDCTTTTSGSGLWQTTTYTYSGTSNNTDKYSMTASDATELSKIFETISTDVSSDSTSVTLNAESVMKDIMGDGFTLADDFNVKTDVTIKTVAGSVVNGEIVWGNETENSASASVSGNTVSITGFNYADKYISSGHAGEKICVTITGVLPTTDVTTDEAVNTNAATSGIYATADATEATATFEQPQTIITKKLYVLDYAKTATLTGLDQDTSVTGIVDTFKAVSNSDRSLTQSYGASALSDNTLTYTPTTMSWNGYDSLYVFGKTTNSTVTALQANSNGNLWSKVSVIPANNVYYEDDFITTSSDNTTATGTVGIVYSSGDWTEVGTSAGNTETVNGSTYGWETTLADDTGDSDDASHKTSTDGATATFTFTGTGVDIYSRTDLTTGTVYAKLTGSYENEEGATVSVTKRLIVDDLAESAGTGTYYQIPTVSFNDLTYGTYTVTLTVTSQADGRSTYYLDGVRVYNPLGTVTEDDGDAYVAYAADNELDAVFTEVRDILIKDVKGYSADEDVTGAVFIDEIDGTTKITTGSLTDYVTYGPKNEVYLGENQAIVFKVDASGDNTYYLGLKSADGLGTKAKVTNGDEEAAEITIGHSTDLYYEITPDSDGYIMIQNTGSNLLSITKLRTTTTTSTATDGISTASLDELVTYANSFSLLSTVAYTDTGVEEDSFVDTETDTDTEADADTGDTYEDLDEDDIVIDNPTEDTEEETEETEDNSQQSIFSNLFNSIRNWFNGRR